MSDNVAVLETPHFDRLPQETSLSTELGRMEARFHSLIVTGEGMTRDDLEMLRGQLKNFARLARTLERQPARATVNAEVAAALEDITKAESALVVVKAVLSGRVHSDEMDPAGSAAAWLQRATASLGAVQTRVERRSRR